MSTIPFIIAIVCVWLIIFWYLRDEGLYRGKGRSGSLLDMSVPERRERPTPQWKLRKPRTGRR